MGNQRISLLTEDTSKADTDVIGKVSSGGLGRKMKLGNLVPSPAGAGLTKDVYLAFRTDGNAGDGSLRNPFDASTQVKFDAVLATIFNAGTTDVRVHIGAGTFQFKGPWGGGWKMRSGWQVSGAGMGKTILYVVDGGGVGPSNNPLVYNADTDTNQAVEDLTIDCGCSRFLATYPTRNFGGINLSGASWVRNVELLDVGGGGGECFSCLITGGLHPENIPHNSFIDNVRTFADPAVANVTGPTIVNYQSIAGSPAYAHNGRVENCYSDACLNGLGVPAGFDGAVLIHNRIVNGATGSHGIFNDTFPSRNFVVAHNILTDQNDGWVVASGAIPLTDFSFHHNLIGIAGGGAAFSISTSEVERGRISDNVFFSSDGSPHTAIFLNGADIDSLFFERNTIPSGWTATSITSATNIKFLSNRTPAGVSMIADTIISSAARTPANGFPAFAERDNGSVAQVIADGATGTFGLDSGDDPSGLTSGTTDRITAPVAGWVLIDFTCNFSTLTASGYINLIIQLNGSNLRLAKYLAPLQDRNYHITSFAWLADAADYFQIKIENQTGASMTLSALGQLSYARVQFFPT